MWNIPAITPAVNKKSQFSQFAQAIITVADRQNSTSGACPKIRLPTKIMNKSPNLLLIFVLLCQINATGQLLPRDVQERLKQNQNILDRSDRLREEAQQRMAEMQRIRDAAATQQMAEFQRKQAERQMNTQKAIGRLTGDGPSAGLGPGVPQLWKGGPVCPHGQPVGGHYCVPCYENQREAEAKRLQVAEPPRLWQRETDLKGKVEENAETQETLWRREAYLRKAELEKEEQIDRAFKEIAKKFELINGPDGESREFQKLVESASNQESWSEFKRDPQSMEGGGGPQSSRSDYRSVIDETPREINDQVIGYQDGFVVETPAGMTKEEALREIELATREAAADIRREENINDELRDLLDEANQDARDLRDGGSLQPSSPLPGDGDPIATTIVKQRIQNHINQRKSLDEKAMADPHAPKNYIPKGEEFQKRLDRILERRGQQ